MLEARGIGHGFGTAPILDGVDLRVEPGSVCALVGPNGAGKTTLLRILAGELRPQRGEVSLDGHALSAIDPRALARRRAVLTQDTGVAFAFTVEQVIALGLLPHGIGATSASGRAAIEAALDTTGVGALRERVVPTLSGGERQLVQLARLHVQLRAGRTAEAPARYALLDEPTSALDLRHVGTVERFVGALAEDAGVGVIAVVHDLALASRIAERAVLLGGGGVIATGATASVLTGAHLSAAYGVDVAVEPHPSGRGLIVG